MKILGISGTVYRNDNVYICEVSHKEIEAVMGDAYVESCQERRFKPGEYHDFKAGKKYFDKMNSAVQKTKAFIEGNKEIINTVSEAFCLLAKTTDKKEG